MRPPRTRVIILALLSLPAILFLLIPVIALVRQVAPAGIIASLTTTTVQQAITLSWQTTITATLLTVTFGTPFTYLIARHPTWLIGLLDSLIDLPTVLPPAVAGIALLVTFGRRGLLGPLLNNLGITLSFTTLAVILAQIFVAAPFYLRTAVTAFTQVDRELEQAAALDGASSLRVFWAVTLPLIWPMLIGGMMMTWARALGEFGATIIFAGNFPGRTQTMPLAIYIDFEIDLRTALTLAVIQLIIAFGVLVVIKGMLRQQIR
jgi:molybdate transport system permease protein